MSKRMTITLSEEATRRFLSLAAAKTEAEIEEDCVPSGVCLKIEISPPFGNTVYFGGRMEEIGEADVSFWEKDCD
jgi:hypothetical protein